MTADSQQTDPLASFGPNEWLVDEMYEAYKRDRSSVDPAWWDFFADYDANGSSARTLGSAADPAPAAPAPSAPAAPAPPAAAPAPTAAASAPAPSAPAPPAPALDAPVPAPVATAPAAGPASDDRVVLRGPAARVVANMDASLSVPTATSVRAVPAKLLIENRTLINQNLARGRGGKVSFTHLIGFAVVQALKALPDMNASFAVVDGKPTMTRHAAVNLGLAIDLPKPDGTRQLLVPSIKGSESMDFATFWTTYEDLVRRARGGALGVDDFAGTTISLTNPGTIGTVHSVPRLMQGQGAIVGVGAMEYPAEYQGASTETLARLAVGKVMTLTSTYDHRIIQGALSGDFLRYLHQLLTGEHDFYDTVFESLRVPYAPFTPAHVLAALSAKGGKIA